MQPPSDRFQLIDAELGGTLAEFLRTNYAETGSWEEVSRRLLVQHSVSVVGQTLRRWARQVGIEEKVA